MGKLTSKFDAFEISQIYYNELPAGKRRHKSVRKILQGRSKNGAALLPSENQISQIITDHELNGFIRHTLLPNLAGQIPQYLPLLPEKEDILRQHFGLRDVVVVDASALRPPRGSPALRWQPKDDDLLHDHLGRWAGRILASLMRPEDTVGTGGGRGPYYTAQNCTMPSRNEVPKQLAEHVISMTGLIPAGTLRGDDGFVNRDFDADQIASMLHHKLGTKKNPQLLNCKIADKHAPPNTRNVTVALVGIGALGGGHSLRHIANLNDFGKAQKLITSLNAKVDEVDKLLKSIHPYFHCIGDVCNFYFVLEKARKAIKQESFNELKKHVAAINEIFVNTSLEALSNICNKGVVMAVAGGPHKVEAIADVLNQKRKGSPWITHLITDDLVAERLCRDAATKPRLTVTH